MIEVKEPYNYLIVTVEDNEYYAYHSRNGGIVVDFKEIGGEKVPVVNGRQLDRYEWKYEECKYKISLKKI